ncbi:MAG: sensor domain-containing diguanylate cyclase [Firmicutes bacterium]|nr:sensor domain-containing diguanylate cyclase [Bacillota bacterium]
MKGQAEGDRRPGKIEYYFHAIRLAFVLLLFLKLAVSGGKGPNAGFAPDYYGHLAASIFLYAGIFALSTFGHHRGGIYRSAVPVLDLLVTATVFFWTDTNDGYGLILFQMFLGWTAVQHRLPGTMAALVLVTAIYGLNFLPILKGSVLHGFWFIHDALIFAVIGVFAYSFARIAREESSGRRKNELLVKELKLSFQQQAAASAELERTNMQIKQHAVALEQSRRELLQRNQELQLLAEIFRVMGTTLEIKELLQRALSKTVELLGGNRGSIMLLDQETQELRIDVGVNLSLKLVDRLRLKIGEGVAGRVAKTGEAVIIQDVRNSREFVRFLDQEDVASGMMSAPLRVNGAIQGVINIDACGERSFGQSELDFLVLIAAQLSIAMEKAFLYQQVKLQAITDGQTGLYNLRHLRQRLREEFSKARRQMVPLSFLMVDIDRFKDYNDRYGHPQGDLLLQRVAQLLRDNVREEDIVARYGGEEFAAILPAISAYDAARLAERLRSLAEATLGELDKDGYGHGITLSIGVATFPDNANSAEMLIREADDALYAAKRGGRNRVSTAFHPEGATKSG